VVVPNDVSNVRWATAKADGIVSESQRAVADAALRDLDWRARWRVSQRAQRTYALLGGDDEVTADRLQAAVANCQAVVYGTPIIGLAVYPSVAEALPHLLEAFSGTGRPAGVRSCRSCAGGGAALEWDLTLTPAALVLDLIDTELARFRSGRVNELLTPLPPEWTARIAAEGLRTPDISPERTLETLLERSGLTGD
jgi:hypothetical protein